jgi:hypothetical protein
MEMLDFCVCKVIRSKETGKYNCVERDDTFLKGICDVSSAFSSL